MTRSTLGAIVVAAFAALSLLLPAAERTASVTAASASWTQDQHDAQRTGTTDQEPADPWTYAWSFNGPDGNGGASGFIANAPIESRPIAGGGNIYYSLGSKGLYALNEANGSVVWHDTAATYNDTPAYDSATGDVLVGGTDGVLREFNAQTGAPVRTYSSGSPINKSILVVGNYVYFVTDTGNLYKLAISGLSSAWSQPYGGGALPETSPAYSASRDLIVFCTNQASGATCHAVNNADGTRKWAVQPFPLQPTTVSSGPGTTYTYNTPDLSWPVIADQHGIVFIWFDLGDIGGEVLSAQIPGGGAYWPAGAVNGPSGTNAQTRNFLTAHPNLKTIYALSLDTGQEAFVPALGVIYDEWNMPNGTLAHSFGGMPVVKTWPNGDEVAYTQFRNGTCDAATNNGSGGYRWDSNMGEMELDSSTVPGLNAGDMRFIGWNGLSGCSNYGNAASTYDYITDERNFLIMAGSTLLYAHWDTSDAAQITNRATNLGMTSSSPIGVTTHPSVAQGTDPTKCNGSQNNLTHFLPGPGWCGLSGSAAGRIFNEPAFWAYWNGQGPPQPVFPNGPPQQFAFVSDGYVVVQRAAGDLLVFQTAAAPTPTPTPNLQYSLTLPIEK